jgi:hypothetical protein
MHAHVPFIPRTADAGLACHTRADCDVAMAWARRPDLELTHLDVQIRVERAQGVSDERRRRVIKRESCVRLMQWFDDGHVTHHLMKRKAPTFDL